MSFNFTEINYIWGHFHYRVIDSNNYNH